MKKRNRDTKTPETVNLTEVVLKDLQIAFMGRELTQRRIREAAEAANLAVVRAFEAAGLDPSKEYRFDLATRTATEVVE